MTARVTILIPNYKTPQLTKLCLRLIRKYTDPAIAKVIVIDNDSQDESLTYLRNLSWITLLERKSEPNESPALSHANALDLALLQVDTPYVLSIHTDTLIRKAGWLEFLLSHIEASSEIAGVGSWKLEKKPWLFRWLKKIEYQLQRVYHHLKKTDHMLEGIGKNFYYLRSHCALYRMDLIQQLGLTFAESEEGQHAGKAMHKKLIANGYKMLFLPAEQLLNYLDHINHATMVLNPHLGSTSQSIKKGLKRIEKRLSVFHANQILMDAHLDK